MGYLYLFCYSPAYYCFYVTPNTSVWENIHVKMVPYYDLTNDSRIDDIKYFLVSIIVSWSLSGSYFLIYCFVTLRVAEARVGISLLTILIRAHGRDYLTLD